MPALKGGATGDLYLVLKVVVPTGPEAEALVAPLVSVYRGDVRADLKV